MEKVEIKEKSRQEIEDLKKAWLHDGCWDIEYTEGFEAHFDELKAFRVEREKIGQETYEAKLKEKAIKLGIPDRIDLIKYFDGLEYKIKQLENAIDRIENGN